jgi:dTDP-4-dehydrorhamnose reductase
MLRLAVQDPERTLRVVNDQAGCPTWSYRLALQIEAILKTEKGVFHAVGEGRCTWYDLAGCFLDAMEAPHRLEPCTTEAYPTPARRPANSILENQRLQDAGLCVMKPWDADVIAFARQHREALLKI